VATPKRGGVFRLGCLDSGPATDSLDPNGGWISEANQAIGFALYDTLVRPNYANVPITVENHLAEFVEPAKDLTYYDIRVRDVEFTNGKPITAEDLIYSIQRWFNQKLGGFAGSTMPNVDPTRITKVDSKTVRMHMTRPDSTVPQGMWYSPTAIVPVGFDPKKPVGSGPFTLQSFTPGRQTVFVRNPNYWRSGLPYLDGLQLVGFADPGTTRLNALTSGQIDGADSILPTLVPLLSSNPDIVLANYASQGFNNYCMRVDAAPFKDPRVRKAMALIINRPQAVEQAFGGTRFAQVANELNQTFDPLYDHSIPQTVQDLEQAKSLLKQAGQSDLVVTLQCGHFAPGIVETAQVLQQNAQGAGVKININITNDSATYVSKYYTTAPFKVGYSPGTSSIWNYFTLYLLSKGPYNNTGYAKPKMDSLINQALAATDEATAKQLMGEAQQLLHTDLPMFLPVVYNNINPYNKKFAGIVQAMQWGGGPNLMHFDQVGLA
jgi:peptide/nickel transport system substrate-binding protein